MCVLFKVYICTDSWLEQMIGARGLSIEETVCMCSVCVHLRSWSSVACYSLFLELAVYLVCQQNFSPGNVFIYAGFFHG